MKLRTIIVFLAAIFLVACQKYPLEGKFTGRFSYNDQLVSEVMYSTIDDELNYVSITQGYNQLEFSEDYRYVWYSFDVVEGELYQISRTENTGSITISAYEEDKVTAYYEANPAVLNSKASNIIYANKTGKAYLKIEIHQWRPNFNFDINVNLIDKADILPLNENEEVNYVFTSNEMKIYKFNVEKDKEYKVLLESPVGQTDILTGVLGSLIREGNKGNYFMNEWLRAPHHTVDGNSYYEHFKALESETLYLILCSDYSGQPRLCTYSYEKLPQNTY